MSKTNSISFYEYYDELNITLNNANEVTIEIKDGVYMDYAVKLFNGLDKEQLIKFAYTSRFASEIDYYAFVAKIDTLIIRSIITNYNLLLPCVKYLHIVDADLQNKAYTKDDLEDLKANNIIEDKFIDYIKNLFTNNKLEVLYLHEDY